MRLILLFALILIISGCTSQLEEEKQQPLDNRTIVNESGQKSREETLNNLSQNITLDKTQEDINQQKANIEGFEEQIVKDFNIEADDSGFYIDGKGISSISVKKGNLVRITYLIRGYVYYGGLDFVGCGQTFNAKTGNSTKIEFIAEGTCTVISYWPTSKKVKDKMQVIVS